MKITACCKVVCDPESIETTRDGAVSFDNAVLKISEYDLNAIEAGKQLIKEAGGTLTALSVGGPALKENKIRKDILSRGANDLKVVVDENGVLQDSYQTARALSKAIAEDGGSDLVLCGTGSEDMYAQQVGNQLGVLMNASVVNGVSKITINDGSLVVERTLENAVEVLAVSLPAVLSVSADINVPSIPGMRDIIGAGKKPVAEVGVDLAAFEASTKVESDTAPKKAERKCEVLEGDEAVAVEALYNYLKNEIG